MMKNHCDICDAVFESKIFAKDIEIRGEVLGRVVRLRGLMPVGLDGSLGANFREGRAAMICDSCAMELLRNAPVIQLHPEGEASNV